MKIDNMKVYKLACCLFVLNLVGCSNEDPNLDIITDTGIVSEIECYTEGQDRAVSRTYYEIDNATNMYVSKWDKDDQIAVCFDGSDVARQFNLHKGERTGSAVFYGPVPDNYSSISAVYPFSIYKGRSSSSVEVDMPSTINYDEDKVLCGAMPMYARSTIGSLNFYNLMAVIKISVQGSGLLKSISISSVDGIGMSGNGHIVFDGDNIPLLEMDDRYTDITINISMFLSSAPQELFLPIPAATYWNGLKLEFAFEGKNESRVINGPLSFERSVMRAVKPYEINIPFDFDKYQTKDDEIWYKSKAKQSLLDDCDLGTALVAHSFSDTYQLGIIKADSPIKKIGGPLFQSPKNVSFVKLPSTIQEIAMNGLAHTSIEEFVAPACLRILGVDAFLNCGELRKVIMNNGLESIGQEVFGDCPNIEYVFLPKTLCTIGAYAFRQSTENLDQWDGDCPLIDEDRHSLYSNSAYGLFTEDPVVVDVVAGCNLTEYRIPNQALFLQNYALFGCKKAKKLIIHENFIYFGLEVFMALDELETIICYAQTPPGFDSDEALVVKKLKEIRVPENSIEAYKKAFGWKNFADIIVPI